MAMQAKALEMTWFEVLDEKEYKIPTFFETMSKYVQKYEKK